MAQPDREQSIVSTAEIPQGSQDRSSITLSRRSLIVVLPASLVAVRMGVRPDVADAAGTTPKLAFTTEGFQTMHKMAPNLVGVATSTESHDAKGNGTQFTSNGMMHWNKERNVSTFIDKKSSQVWVSNGTTLMELAKNDPLYQETRDDLKNWQAAIEDHLSGKTNNSSCEDPNKKYAQVLIPVPGKPGLYYTDASKCTTIYYPGFKSNPKDDSGSAVKRQDPVNPSGSLKHIQPIKGSGRPIFLHEQA